MHSRPMIQNAFLIPQLPYTYGGPPNDCIMCIVFEIDPLGFRFSLSAFPCGGGCTYTGSNLLHEQSLADVVPRAVFEEGGIRYAYGRGEQVHTQRARALFPMVVRVSLLFCWCFTGVYRAAIFAILPWRQTKFVYLSAVVYTTMAA